MHTGGGCGCGYRSDFPELMTPTLDEVWRRQVWLRGDRERPTIDGEGTGKGSWKFREALVFWMFGSV